MTNTSVLYVDDEPQACKWFARMFGDEFAVRTAAGMAEALGVVRQPGANVAIVVTDYRMPGGSGLDLLRALQAEGFGQLVTMLVTAQADRDVIMAAVNEGGVVRVIEKPFEPQATRAALRDAAHVHRLRQEHRLVRNQRAEAMYETLRFLAKEMSPALRSIHDAVITIRGLHQPRTPDDAVLRAMNSTQASAMYCQSLLATFLESVEQALPSRSAMAPQPSSLVPDLLEDFPFAGGERDWITCDAAPGFDIPGRHDLVRLVLHALLKDILLSLRPTAQPALRIEAGVDARSLGARPWIRFDDNGPGFEPGKLRSLALAPEPAADEGGAGLALCRRILHSLGGAVEVSRDAAGHNSVSLLFPPNPQQEEG